MKYTKQELLGAILEWTYRYEVIENGNDVQIKGIEKCKLYPQYNLETLNHEISRGICRIISLSKILAYEIY